MTSDTTALRVTIVSTNKSLLRELSWSLTTFGYNVLPSSDWSDDAPWQQINQPSLLLMDATDSAEVRQALSAARWPAYTYRIALHGPGAVDDVAQLLALGADDVIHQPINTCELLTRLRSGVRRLEFERRLQAMRTHDPQTGLATKQGLICALESSNDELNGVDGALVTMGIDFLELIRDQHGQRAVRSLNAALARCVQEHRSQRDQCGELEPGVFAVLLRDATVEEGRRFAGKVADQMCGRETLAREVRTRPTISAVVLEWSAGISPSELIQQGLTTLAHMKSYGGNLILDASDVEREILAWRQQMEAGVPFESVVAQDVMEAFPLMLPSGDAETALSRARQLSALAYDRPLPPRIPIVDGQGVLRGTADLSSIKKHTEEGSQPLTSQPASMTVTVDHNLPLSELFEKFSTVEDGYLIVVEGERPLGYITGEGLASLIMDRLDHHTYRPEFEGESSARSLVVPLHPSQFAAQEGSPCASQASPAQTA